MVSNKNDKPRRRYELRERARQRESTRLKITEAAVELHGTVGPARTTISDVAKLAGVQRMTVYNHFATDGELFDACSTHWFTQRIGGGKCNGSCGIEVPSSASLVRKASLAPEIRAGSVGLELSDDFACVRHQGIACVLDTPLMHVCFELRNQTTDERAGADVE